MNASYLLRRLALLSFGLSAPLALAHPGHDGGHDLTWDFVGEVTHHLTSPYHLVPVAVVGAAGYFLLRRAAKRRNAARNRD